jgi:hypothetical protein
MQIPCVIVYAYSIYIKKNVFQTKKAGDAHPTEEKRKGRWHRLSSLWLFTGRRPVPLIKARLPVPRPEAHRLNPPVSPFFIFAKAAFLSYSRR